MAYLSGGGRRNDYVDDEGVPAVYDHSGLKNCHGCLTYTCVVRDERFANLSSKWREAIKLENKTSIKPPAA